MDATIPTILLVNAVTLGIVASAWLRERQRHRMTRRTLAWWKRNSTVKSDVFKGVV